jgi:hypothetical protein
MSDPIQTTARATIIACWDALGQARAHIAGETPDETSAPPESIQNAVLEMIDEAIEDCRRTIANGI